MKKPIFFAIFLVLFLAGPALAGTDTPLVKPNTFSGGTAAMAAEVNENFDTLYDRVNLIQADLLVPPIWQCTMDIVTLPMAAGGWYVVPKDIGTPDINIDTSGSTFAYSSDNGSFTAGKAGYYLIDFNTFLSLEGDNRFFFFLVSINGSQAARSSVHVDSQYGDINWTVNRTIACEAGDVIICRITAPDSAVLSGDTVGDPYFSIRYLGPKMTPSKP